MTSPRRPKRAGTRRRWRAALAAALAALVAGGCGVVSTTPPAPTPADFPGIASGLTNRSIRVDRIRSGDAGCDDPSLAPTAISMTMSGLDQTEPVPVYVYIFRNRQAWERRLMDVYACARAYAPDPDAFEVIEASPFVVASPGPWAPRFEAELRAGIVEAAGTGG